MRNLSCWGKKYLIFISVMLYGMVCCAQTVDIFIVNSEGKPVENVCILKLPERILLCYTDERGRSRIETDNYAKEDEVEFTSLGYISEKRTIESLRQMKEPLILKKEHILLDEVLVVKGHLSFDQILGKATRQMALSRNKKRGWEIRYWGEGSFSRLLTCKGLPVHTWKSRGFFLTTGNVAKEVNGWDWDMAYGFYFLPEYVARSFDFRNDGKDTLDRKYISIGGPRGDKLNYNVTEYPKLFKTMRALYLFGPIFSKKEYFDYKLLEEKDEVFVISFVTNRKFYFSKNRVLMDGTLELDKKTLRLCKMDIKHFSDERFQFTMNKTYMHPYEKSIQAEFAYSGDGECYIKHCTLEVEWLYERSSEKRIGSREESPRPYPVRDQLVEKERWDCGEYFPFSRSLYTVECTDKTFQLRLRRMHYFPEGGYDSDKLKEVPLSEEFLLAEKVLGKFCSIEEQYASNSRQIYVIWEQRYPSKDDIYFTMELKNRLMDNLNKCVKQFRYEH